MIQRGISIICFLLFTITALAQDDDLLKKADLFIKNNELDKAIQFINDELKKFPNVLLENKKAEILITQGSLPEAEGIIKNLQSKKLTDFEQAVTLSNNGNLQLNKGRFDLSLENLQAAITLFQNTQKQNTSEAAQCLAMLAILYNSTGKYKQAEENGLIALQIREHLFGDNTEETAASFNDLGLIYTSTDPDKALEYYEKALPIYELLHGRQHSKIAIVSTNIGFIYSQLELYGDAITNFETALSIWRSIYPGGHPNEAFVLTNLGKTYVKMGDLKTAYEYFQKALTIYQKSYGTKHPNVSTTLNEIGILKYSENKFDEAITSFQQAIIANVGYFNDLTGNPIIKDFYNGHVLLYSIRWKAQALESRHYNKTLKLQDLKLALSCLYSCDTLIDDIRHHISDESDKISLGDQANEVYEDGVRIAQAMSEITLSSNYYEEAAFYFAEKSKSAVLQESIADVNAKSFAGIPSTLIEEEKGLKASITFLSQKLAQKPSPEEEKYIRESLFNLNREYDNFIKKLEKEFPNYYNLKFSRAAPDIVQLQKIIAPRTAVVSYFIAEKNKRIYQFVITSKKFTIHNLTLPDHFDRLIKGFSNSLFFSSMPTYHSSGERLRKTLVPRLPLGISNLIIVPSGKLSTLPFEALPYKKSSTSDFQFVPYLIKRYSISYEFSTGLIAQKTQAPISTATPSIFLCAPIQFTDKENLNELPGTDQEVTTIAGLFNKGNSSVLKNTDANEGYVKSGGLKKFNYLHFATHGIVDETNPELSRIILNTNDHEDGHLFAGEIYNLDLDADLTVLSACQTGLGKLSKGEGVVGLSRALIYAGSQNLMVSFWSVADESTAVLMTDFYKDHLQQKMDFKKALQEAKLQMIQKGKFSSPYYWAPFILIGN
jgi:CHAT domain-containing protein/Tfp pilus assembly protein PilF